MKMRFLGKTGLQVSELCLGTQDFGSRGVFKKTGEIGEKEADYIVSVAFDAGLNFFNTAASYSDGAAEETLGKALGARRHKAIIVTKIHPERKRNINDGALSRKNIIEGCADSLKRLRTDYIDVYEIHRFDDYTPLEVTLKALDDLIKEGKVRYIGCSNFAGWQMMKALAISHENRWASFVALEAMYSLAARWLEFELVPLCLDQGVSILAWSPLHGGLLSGKYRRNQPWPEGTRFGRPEDTWLRPIDPEKLYDIVDELQSISTQHYATISQTALTYLLRKPGVSSLIIGIRNAKQLEEDLKATDWEMTKEEVARLDKISEPLRRYPYAARIAPPPISEPPVT
jgi:aryl-alcohol dehydrogenase-like predicted oxidoreductase